MTGRECREGLRRDLLVGWALFFVIVIGADAAAADAFTEPEVEAKKLGPAPSYSEVAVSADGQHIAVIERRGGKSVLTHDGTELGVYDTAQRLAISADGKVAACAASSGNEWFVVVNGKAGPKHANLTGPALSADGRHVAYFVSTSGRTGAVYLDGVEQKNVDAQGPDGPALSANGRLAFAAHATGTFIKPNTGGPTRPAHDRPATWDHPEITTDNLERRTFVMCDNRRGRVYDDVGPPCFSPNGAGLAYAASLDRRAYAVVNEERSADGYEAIVRFVWSPDSRRLACVVKAPGNKQCVVVGAKRLEICDDIGTVAFSPHAERLAYAATQGGRRLVVCEGKKGGPDGGDIGWIGFSPDAKHLAWVAQTSRRCAMAIDGIEGPAHDRIVVPEAAQLKDKLRYVAIDRGEARLVEKKWPVDSDWTKGMK